VSDSIQIAPSPIHGRGGFAARFIPRGARIVEYAGEKISKAESLRRCQAQNWFIFGLDEEFDLDGNVEWNPARFLNHSCAPNGEALCEEGRVWIAALRDIPPGEEITFNYGYDLTDYKEHPCRCGAPGCVGYIVAEEFFAHLRTYRDQALRKNF
jgi:SET domain-containing protein